MGLDKARLPLRGLPMAAAVAEVFAAAGYPATLIRRGLADGLPWIDRVGEPLSVIREAEDGRGHPLAGLASALEDAATHGAGAVLVAPCDLDGLDEASVAALAYGPCVAEGPDGRRHLLAHVPVDRLGAVVRGWREGASVRTILADLPGLALPAAALHNVNRPEDRRERPLDALAARLPEGIDVEQVIAAEQERQQQRGIVDVRPSSVSCPS